MSMWTVATGPICADAKATGDSHILHSVWFCWTKTAMPAIVRSNLGRKDPEKRGNSSFMTFPERFSNLPEYAFPRLRQLLDAHAPGGEVMHFTIGEPRHGMPDFVAPILAENMQGFEKYPNNNGSDELLSATANWLNRRFGAVVDPLTQILALNGTREGLMNACIALCPESKNGKQPVVLSPNPFYQVYAVAALTVGAEPVFCASA